MKNDDEINSELAGKVIFWVLIFPLILVVGIKSCNTNLDEYNNKKALAKQEEEYSHHRNSIQCFQNGVLYKTYLVGHVYDTCYNQYYKQGKRHYTNIICSNRINTTVIDTNEKINIGLENCIITELPDV